MSTRNSKVDAFVSRAKRWRGEPEKLRAILLACGLGEDLKWGIPKILAGKGMNDR